MELIRVGDKVISKDKIFRMITKILDLRSQGFSQADSARELDVERTFISRLESLGEIYKGERIALLGFPIANKEEISKMALNLGVEFILLMSEEERWSFVQREGIDIFNQLMEILVSLKDYDLIIFLGSDMRIDLVDNLLDGKVIGIEIGRSPITEDIVVDVSKLEGMIVNLCVNSSKGGS